MFVSVVPILLLALLIGVLIAARIWTKHAPVKHVSCSRCRYTVEFTPSQHCSECGADLLRVGVVTPEMGKTPRRPHRTVLAALIAAVLTAGVAIAALIITSRVMSTLYLVERRMLVDGPESSAYQAAEVRLDSYRRGSVTTFRSVCFRIEHHDGTWSRQKCFRLAEPDFYYELIVERSNGSVTNRGVITPTQGDPRGRYSIVKPADVPIEELQQWAGTIGLDVNSPAIQCELDDLIRVATEFFHTRGTTVYDLAHFSPTQFRSFMNVTSTNPPEAGYAALLTGALAGLGFIGSIVRSVKREKRLQQAAASDWLAARRVI